MTEKFYCKLTVNKYARLANSSSFYEVCTTSRIKRNLMTNKKLTLIGRECLDTLW